MLRWTCTLDLTPPQSDFTLTLSVSFLPSHCWYLTICYLPHNGRKQLLLTAQSPGCPRTPSATTCSASFLPMLLSPQPTGSPVLKLSAPTVHPGDPFQTEHSSHGISSHFRCSSGHTVSLNEVYIKSTCLWNEYTKEKSTCRFFLMDSLYVLSQIFRGRKVPCQLLNRERIASAYIL